MSFDVSMRMRMRARRSSTLSVFDIEVGMMTGSMPCTTEYTDGSMYTWMIRLLL